MLNYIYTQRGVIELIRILAVIKDESKVIEFQKLKNKIYPQFEKMKIAGEITDRVATMGLVTVRFPKELGGEMELPEKLVDTVLLFED